MAKKYILHPGYVRSANDSNIHFINAVALARLYGIPFGECLVQRDDEPKIVVEGAKHLYPMSNGDYRING